MSTGTESIFTPDGHKRILNQEPSDPRKLHRFANAPSIDVMAPSDIVDFDAWPSQVKIKDQDGAGACQGHASATVTEFARVMAGMPHVPLSAWWIYGSLVMGRDRGSNILDGLELIETKGVAPESDVEYGDYSGRYSAQAQADAARYRVELGNQLRTWEEILTTIARRRAVNLSIRATNGWSGRLDANGCPPVGRGPGNHSVACGGAIKTLPGTTDKAIRMPNSWGTQWGLNGFCWLTQAHIESGTWFEAFEVIGVVRDPQDTAPVAA